jgi:protein subunit release factor A
MAELELLEKIEVYEKNYSEIMQKMAEAGKRNDVETIKECGKKIANLEEIIDLAKNNITVILSIKPESRNVIIGKTRKIFNGEYLSILATISAR